MAGPALRPTGMNDDRDLASQLGGGPAAIFKQLLDVVQAIGKYGLATVIFAFPVVLGCYGLYFLYLAVSTSQVNMGRAVVGMFATIFSPGLTFLLLYAFTKWDLWERLLVKARAKD